jgi:predicted Fe-Mo cluster-binding NifX family protein
VAGCLHYGHRVRVAVPLFGDEISPRFCFARQALIVDWQDDSVHKRSLVRLGGTSYPERLEILARRGATLLICGAFPLEHFSEAKSLGIRVVCGASGLVPRSDHDLSALLATFALRESIPYFEPPHVT